MRSEHSKEGASAVRVRMRLLLLLLCRLRSFHLRPRALPFPCLSFSLSIPLQWHRLPGLPVSATAFHSMPFHSRRQAPEPACPRRCPSESESRVINRPSLLIRVLNILTMSDPKSMQQ